MSARESTHPWRIATQCSRCKHACGVKAGSVQCGNKDGPLFGRVVASSFGCVAGEPIDDGGKVCIPVAISRQLRDAVESYAPVHGGTVDVAIAKAAKQIYDAANFHNLNPDDFTRAPLASCEMACAEG